MCIPGRVESRSQLISRCRVSPTWASLWSSVVVGGVVVSWCRSVVVVDSARGSGLSQRLIEGVKGGKSARVGRGLLARVKNRLEARKERGKVRTPTVHMLSN